MTRIGFLAMDIGVESSGVARVVCELAPALAAQGAEVTVLAVERKGHRLPDLRGVDVRVASCTRLARGLDLAPRLSSMVRDIARSVDCMTVHGFWALPLVAGTRAALKAGAPVLLSPHGMFSSYSLQNRGLRKTVALGLGFRRVLENVSAFHATSQAERAEIRALGLEQEVCVVPNGVELPALDETIDRTRQRSVLFMSRIHPKKGIPLLLEAWARLGAGRAGWRLDIAGPDELQHLAEAQALARRLGLSEVRFLGPLHGPEKQRALQEADLFVLPSLNENFGLVIGEALASGTPVLTTDRTPWSVLEERGCGWCVPASVDAVLAALETALALPRSELQRRGLVGRDLIAATYAWSHVAASYMSAVDSVAARRERGA